MWISVASAERSTQQRRASRDWYLAGYIVVRHDKDGTLVQDREICQTRAAGYLKLEDCRCVRSHSQCLLALREKGWVGGRKKIDFCGFSVLFQLHQKANSCSRLCPTVSVSFLSILMLMSTRTLLSGRRRGRVDLGADCLVISVPTSVS